MLHLYLLVGFHRVLHTVLAIGHRAVQVSSFSFRSATLSFNAAVVLGPWYPIFECGDDDTSPLT